MPLTIDTPLSFYSIPVVWFTTFYPMNAKFALINKTIGYNNLKPRQNTQVIASDPKVSPETAARAARMEGAHLNGNEMLPLWIGAVLAANFAGLSNRTLNLSSAAFISLRVLYNYFYINQKTEAQSWFRSAIFFAALPIPLTLFIKAANKLRLQSL
ncbi:hypothetical protein PUNSTDRAFT_120682 [Punctularia strigosozonata HHB-11173 SS5]|uniref:uncharacterized protein n=1 Tax=Punctularia strigosozonata (strain HHB-11173) TaxID=741275 RepID=UPI00044174AC|nr:uncharacterized protein PUNSTDRAFT_120682 [Punctularia strigosozonata HHB-11173 SS5]EIN08260.1 hypothetical protein PUNSTDRAFT_120682 [Punctularia strigosozonata HHB-11173 SS5]